MEVVNRERIDSRLPVEAREGLLIDVCNNYAMGVFNDWDAVVMYIQPFRKQMSFSEYVRDHYSSQAPLPTYHGTICFMWSDYLKCPVMLHSHIEEWKGRGLRAF